MLEPSVRQPYGNVNRWFTTLINQPQFKNVLGEVKLCNKATVYDAKKAAIETQSKKEKKPKQEKPKEEKKPAPKPAQNDDEEEPDPLLVEPKSKDPFEQFPKGYSKVITNKLVLFVFLILEILISMISSDFILIIPKKNLFRTFGRNLTKKTTLFGFANTSIPKNLLWCL